jgi:6-phosphogluconolactonase (cycloisomerase 2 family)
MQMAHPGGSDYAEKPENGGASLEIETRLGVESRSISRDKPGRFSAVRRPIPADHIRGVHPQTIHLKPGARCAYKGGLMQSTKNTNLAGFESAFSRRNFLMGAAALAAVANMPNAFGQQPTGAPRGTVWLYISTYTPNGKGIYLCQLNLSTGKLDVLKLVAPALPASGATPATTSPSTIALDPTRTHLYAGNEYGPPGAVSAYSINRLTGDLTLLNGQPTLGAPAYVSVDQHGRYLFSAEYTGGWFEVFPITVGGLLGPAVFQQQDLDNINAAGFGKTMPATNAPPGSFAFSAHEGPNGHPHQMETDPSNQWVVGTDAGQDRIYVWKLTQGAATPLTPAATPFVNAPPGDGPRHFAFHPNGVWMYSIQEEASTIMFWRFDPATGALSQQQVIPSVPQGFAGTDFTSEIRVSADGNFVYGANRLSDTIGVFSVGRNGRLTQVSYASTLGDYPRIFTIDPSGRFIVSGNQRADNVTTFRINPGGGNQGENQGNDDDQGENRGGQGHGPGSLTFTGNYTPVGSPSGMVFLT